MGSKRRIAKEIIPIITAGRTNEYYVEPFVGGANVIEHIKGNRIGNDANQYVIAMFKALQNGWMPPNELTEQQYISIKNNKQHFRDELVGFAGIGCSFGGKWFSGYARGEGRNYCEESCINLIKQRPGIMGVDFISGDYKDILIPYGSYVYCDPPYGNTGYRGIHFDNEEFLDWCNYVSENCTVFISGYICPPGWDTVWEKPINSNLGLKGETYSIESIFSKRKA